MITDLHVAAHFLDPEFHHELQHRNDRQTHAIRTIVEKVLGNDVDVSGVSDELYNYENKRLFYDDQGLWAKASECSARKWWDKEGSRDGVLRRAAMKILGQPSSSGAAERNWSVHSIIKTKRRNRMSHSLLDDLVFMYANIKLKNRLRKSSSIEEFVQWNEEYMEAVPVENPEEEDDDELPIDPYHQDNL
ncbi:hypothetical protein GEMRC1_001796 [Eukaryota sp. GEM-RC1]